MAAVYEVSDPFDDPEVDAEQDAATERVREVEAKGRRDAVVEAFLEVSRILEPLDPVARVRVVRAVRALLGMD